MSRSAFVRTLSGRLQGMEVDSVTVRFGDGGRAILDVVMLHIVRHVAVCA